MEYPVAEFIQQLRITNMFKTPSPRWVALASKVVSHFLTTDRSKSGGLSGTHFEEFAFMMEDMHRLEKNKEEYELVFLNRLFIRFLGTIEFKCAQTRMTVAIWI